MLKLHEMMGDTANFAALTACFFFCAYVWTQAEMWAFFALVNTVIVGLAVVIWFLTEPKLR